MFARHATNCVSEENSIIKYGDNNESQCCDVANNF